MSIFEAVMLLCFGAAWPFSIYRSYISQSNKGKSILFLCVVFAGYVSGIIHKVLYSFDKVFILYILNLVMVGADMALYFRNRKVQSSPV